MQTYNVVLVGYLNRIKLENYLLSNFKFKCNFSSVLFSQIHDSFVYVW